MNPNPRKRSTDRRQGQDRGDTRTSAPRTAHVIDTRIVRIGAHDHRPATPPTAPPPLTTRRSGRTQDRARLLLPDALADLTGLVPGTDAQRDVFDTGQVVYTPLPGQDAARLTWQADRLLRIHEAAARQAWAIQMSLDGRAPYAEVGPSGRKKRRQIEARRRIPRDYPHQTTDRTDPTD